MQTILDALDMSDTYGSMGRGLPSGAKGIFALVQPFKPNMTLSVSPYTTSNPRQDMMAQSHRGDTQALFEKGISKVMLKFC